MRAMPTAAMLGMTCLCAAADAEPRPWVTIRGLYGGVPTELMSDGRRLADSGVNAVWIGSGGVNEERLKALRDQGVKVFAEFNTLHVASYLDDHPDAAPVGVDGRPCPPPHDWQGVSPTHEGYRRWRMEAFRTLLETYPIDGVWLDYHHAHASWERSDPMLPDTGFDPRSLKLFQEQTGITLPEQPTPELARLLLTTYHEPWVQWRCEVLTDWVREFRDIRDATRPGALLGTFHCPWTDTDLDGALRRKLFIDLRAQAQYLDVFSPMPYHMRFGHGADPDWISRQTAWLGSYLGFEGRADERHRIWPIVQLADWDDPVLAEQVEMVLDHGTRRPATGVIIFHWSGLSQSPAKVEGMRRFYLDIAPRP